MAEMVVTGMGIGSVQSRIWLCPASCPLPNWYLNPGIWLQGRKIKNKRVG